MREWILYHMTAFLLGIVLDLIIGDPHQMPHPVRAVGSLILVLRRALFREDHRDPGKEKARGICLWFAVVFPVLAITLGIMICAYTLHPWAGILTEAVLTCYCLAAKCLCKESMAVYQKLIARDIDGARYALSMIVGRDTDCLTEEEVIKAAVETVAENTSDGVIAPLLYAAIGGPVLAMAYKAVNTMDSMIGYRNETYEHFGFFAARADDFFNYLPSRISALCMIAGSGILHIFSKEYDGKEAARIWKRDRRNHSSPNSAQTESVCAGAIGLRLGGTHLYQGKPVEKPAIGDEKHKAEPDDIKRANRLMFASQAVCTGIVTLAAAFLFGLLF